MSKDILKISKKEYRVRLYLTLFTFLNKYKIGTLCIVLLLSLNTKSYAQQENDTVIYTDISSIPITTDESLIKKHSPGKALWMSAVLPGLGQVYNKQAWKIPIIYALGGTTTYFAITNYKNAQKFKKEYIRRDHKDSANYDPNYLNYPDQSIYNLYNSYNKNFQLMIVLTAAVYLLNLVDAYVSAHLFTFDLTDDISMQIVPEINYSSILFTNRPEFGFRLKLSF